MKKEKGIGTKICKHCKSEIAADAKICPNCRKKQGGSKLLIVAIIIIVLGILGSIGGSNDSEPEEIEYTQVNIQELYDDLETNPAAASEKYKDTYIEFTGKMDVIDSDLKYISVYPTDGIHIIGISSYLKNDEQKDFVKSSARGDIVTVKGKCTEVGEIIGYSVDVMELSK